MTAPPAIAAALRAMLPPPVDLQHAWIAEQDAAMSSASAGHAEEAAAVAHAVPQRRREFAAGRNCARRALAAAGAPGAHELALPADAQRLPRWPSGYLGSITHDAQWCAVAVAASTGCVGLGIDVEIVERLHPPLEAGIATAAERARWLEGRDAVARQRMLAMVFSAKEACFKAHFPHTGAWLDFTDAELHGLPQHVEATAADGSGRFRLALLKPAGRYPAGHVFEGAVALADGRVCAAVYLRA